MPDERTGTSGSASGTGFAFRTEWLAESREAPLRSDRQAIDPHFHFFDRSEFFPHYRPEDLRADTSAQRIAQAVFVQCAEHLRTEGPDHLRPVGETEWVDSLAHTMRTGAGVQVGAIVGDARLSLGEIIGETLDAHREASPLFRGIRDIGTWDADPTIDSADAATDLDAYANPAFRAGFAELARRDLSFDAYNYHTQLFSLEALARSFPDTRIVLDHLGTPLGIGPYGGKREEVFADWSRGMDSLADCPNVFVKLGGMAMPWNGFDWGERDRAPSSDDFVDVYARWYHHAIERFGPARCMFESNFPVDRLAVDYTVLWNFFEKLAATYSATEQDDLFRGTAARVYRISTGE